MTVYLKGKEINLDPKRIIGEGGEAKVYEHKGLALKIYHPQFATKERGDKLKAYPRNVPDALIRPIEIAVDGRNKVLGYSMKHVKDAESMIMLSNRKFRANFSDEKVLKILLNTLITLKEIHNVRIIVGDFNDLNLLFKDEEIFFIDADSMQYGGFACEVATEYFLDPRLYGMDFSKNTVFTKDSDYYSFAVMLFKSLLYVNPFGGVHKKYATFIKRADSRISVFNKNVKYPKAAIHFGILPDDILDYFQKVFEKDLRGEFPTELLENLRFTKCIACGETHARTICPNCSHNAPAAVKEVIVVNRECIASIVFRTKGRIIESKIEKGGLKVLYEENGTVKREDGQIILLKKSDNFTRFSIMGKKTLIGRKSKIVIVEDGKILSQNTTGILGNLPMFTSSGSEYFRSQGSSLIKGENKIVGQILENQTWIKTGDKFGFGFYRIGLKTVYFIFDHSNNGINDTVNLPNIEGQLVDAECFFSKTHVLFLTTTVEKGKTLNSMYLIDKSGNVISSLKEEAENSKILSGIHNKVLSGNKILTASDEGLILLESEQKTIKEVMLFPDTEPFVNEDVELFTVSEGVYVVSEKDVKLLKLT